MSRGAPEVCAGLGLLAGSLSVHLGGESERLPVYRAAIAAGELGPGYAADDGAALVFTRDRAARMRRVAARGPRAAGGAR